MNRERRQMRVGSARRDVASWQEEEEAVEQVEEAVGGSHF